MSNAQFAGDGGLAACVDRCAQRLQAGVLQGLEDLIDRSGLLEWSE